MNKEEEEEKKELTDAEKKLFDEQMEHKRIAEEYQADENYTTGKPDKMPKWMRGNLPEPDEDLTKGWKKVGEEYQKREQDEAKKALEDELKPKSEDGKKEADKEAKELEEMGKKK